MHSCNTVTNWQQHYSPVFVRCSVNVHRPRNSISCSFFVCWGPRLCEYLCIFIMYTFEVARIFVEGLLSLWWLFFALCAIRHPPNICYHAKMFHTQIPCFALFAQAAACIMNFPNLLLFIFIFHALVACRAQFSRNLLKLEVPIIHLFQPYADIEYESFVRLRISATNTPCPMWFAEVSIQHLRVEEVRRVDF